MTPEQLTALREDNARLADYEAGHERVFDYALCFVSVVLLSVSAIERHLAGSAFFAVTLLAMFIRNRLFVVALQMQRQINEDAEQIKSELQKDIPLETNWYEKFLTAVSYSAIALFVIGATLYIIGV